MRATFLTIFGFALLYLAICFYISVIKNNAYDLVKVGDTQASVINQFGNPDVREKRGILFSRYASHECRRPCAERFWFENRLNFNTEAWSIEFDEDNHVVKKSHWVSP